MANKLARPIRVLIVDDSRTIRSLIRLGLERDTRVEVIGEASDAYEARELIKTLNPDVLTLDVEMPRMDGLAFLEKIMRLRPMPVVMVSSRTAEQSEVAVRALTLGAVDCIDLKKLLQDDADSKKIADTIVMAASASIKARKPVGYFPEKLPGDNFRWNGRFVVVGSSTGGVETLIRILSGFPTNGPPVVVAQHMPAHFLASFAKRLDALIKPSVRIALRDQALRPGEILLAGGGSDHVEICVGDPFKIGLVPASSSDLYTPSIERLFLSASEFGDKAVGVILTGMGRDGAAGLLKMRNNGAHTIAQSGRTAVVDGMPRAARELDAACEVTDLDKISERILAATGRFIGGPA